MGVIDLPIFSRFTKYNILVAAGFSLRKLHTLKGAATTSKTTSFVSISLIEYRASFND